LGGSALDPEIQESGIASEKLNKVLVIGNGESRKVVDLENLKKKFYTIGCNALHRDFISDKLVCCDRRMADESTENPLTKQTEIYVRKEWYHFFRKIKKNKNIRLVPDLPYKGTERRDDPINWGSGGYAVLLAALEFDHIYLLGFDLYPNIDNKFNNIYKNSQNYNKEDDRPVDPSYWIHQIAKIFTLFREKNFYIINEEEWKIPDQWNRNNIQFIKIKDFVS
jgi:hypothetical protein